MAKHTEVDTGGLGDPPPNQDSTKPKLPVRKVVDLGDQPVTPTFREDPHYIAVEKFLREALASRRISHTEYRNLAAQAQADSTSGRLPGLIGVYSVTDEADFTEADFNAYSEYLVGSVIEENELKVRAAENLTLDRVERDLVKSEKDRTKRIANAWDRAYSGIERRLRDIAEDRTLDPLTQGQAQATLTNFLSEPVEEKLFNAFVDFVEQEMEADEARFAAQAVYRGDLAILEAGLLEPSFTPFGILLETTAAATWLQQNINVALTASRPDLELGTFDQVRIKGDMLQGLVPILQREGVRHDALSDLALILNSPSSGILSGLLGDTLDGSRSERQQEALSVVYRAFNTVLLDNLGQ
jgi:hypothetical protein